MTWSINAQGITGDIEKVRELISRLGNILAEPEYGTGSSQVSSPLGLVSNFHRVPDQGTVGAESEGPEGRDGGTAQSSGDAVPSIQS